MDDSGQSTQDQHADRNLKGKVQAEGVSVGNKVFIGNWSRGHFGKKKTLSTFCLCPLWETKNNGLIDLAKET